MTKKAKQAAFDAAVKSAAKQRNAIQQSTVDGVVALLRQAFADIEEKLNNQPSDYELWHYPQVKKAIEQTLGEFGELAGKQAGVGQAQAWDAGQDLIDRPLEAAEISIEGIAPQIDKGQLLAMQSFLTGKMKDVGAVAVTKINAQLGLTIIGSQGIEDTIKGIQAAETMSRKRATTIVRTEVGRAYAVASQARATQAADHVPGLQKQWRRSGKIHSRRSHDFTDGQIRPVNKPFIIGTGAVIDGKEGNGPRLMHPHDPKAPAKETVNCGCISLPFMSEWKDAGVLKDAGKRAFTPEEIALNPAKADYAAMQAGPSIDDIFKAQDAAKAQKAVKGALLGVAKEQGQLALDRALAAMDAKVAAFKLQEALAGNLGKWHKMAAQKLPAAGGKPLDELAAELQASAKQKAAVTAYKKAMLAGKQPTKAQALAFSSLSETDQAAIEAGIKLKIGQQSAAADLALASGRTEANVGRVAVRDIGPWQQIGPQAGSNPGGLFQAEDGAKWYVKFPADAARAHNEVLGGKLYKLVGIETPEIALISKDGRIGVASRIIDGLSRDSAALTSGSVGGISEGFGADAWLANWDVVGMGYDNMLVKGGRAWRVDVGGALLYRAQGAAKGSAFGSNVLELQSLRDASMNPQAAAVFGKLSAPQIKASVARVLATNDDAVRQLVMTFGGGSLESRNALADLLIARKGYLAKTFPDILPKIAEARKLAVEQARIEARSTLEGLDQDVLSAIKGIASRAKSGAALEAKDIARVSAAAMRYQALLDAEALSDSSLSAIKAHYGPWLEHLQTAIAGGAGSPAKWAVSDAFAGLKSAAVEVNPAKVKPAFAPFLFGEGPMFSAADVKAALRAVESRLGVSDYLSKAKLPRNSADADAFDKMPEGYRRAPWSWTPSHIYDKVNQQLLTEASGGAKAAVEVKEYERLLNDALKNAPESRKHKGMSARGMFNDSAQAKAFYERMLDLHDSGGTYQMETFGSSSVGDTPAFSGKELWLHINGKSGVHISSISQYQSENEVLFGTEHQFKVLNCYTKAGKFHVDLKEI